MIRSSLLFCALLVQLCSVAQFRISGAERKILDSISLQDVAAGAPGIATAIIYNGRVVYQKCGGYADLLDSSVITPQLSLQGVLLIMHC